MSRLAAILCILAIAVAIVPAASTGASGGPTDSLTGSGWRGTVATPNTPHTHIAVSAHDGPQGVSGSFASINATNPLLDFRGNVTCLYVNGDHAVVGGVTTSGGGPGQVGTGFAVGFVDNPSPTPDQVTFSDVAIGVPVDCVGESFLFTLELFPVLRGNVEINDAP